MAKALVGLEEPTQALVEIEKSIAADPDMPEALLLKASLLLRLGHEDALVSTLQALVARPDATRETFETAGLFLLLAGRLDATRTIAEGAMRRGLHSPGLESMARVVVRSQNGPDWPKTYEYRSSNYDVVSDIDAATCEKAAGVLEEALLDFKVNVHALKAEATKRHYKVFLFAGKEGFLRYHSDASVMGGPLPGSIAGLYSPVLKQLLIWNLPNRDAMMRTVRHEGFHQYLDRLLPDPPVWFNEGLAVYYEGMLRVGGSLKTDTPRPDFVEYLNAAPLVPARDFLEIRPKEFYATAPHSYAQAWLLIHMMRHGGMKYRDAYHALLKNLDTLSGPEATDVAFTDSVLASIDADLKAHLASMAPKK